MSTFQGQSGQVEFLATMKNLNQKQRELVYDLTQRLQTPLESPLYLQLNILSLMELHSPFNGRFIPTFQSPIEIPGLHCNGTGMILFIKQYRLASTLLSERFCHENAIIEIQAIRVHDKLLFFLYCNQAHRHYSSFKLWKPIYKGSLTSYNGLR